MAGKKQVRSAEESKPLDWQQHIATAAYYRWLAQGSPEGTELRNWLDAEAEMYQRKAGASPTPIDNAEGK